MHYQTLVDLVMASPSQPQLAARGGALLSAASRELGRHSAPELSGILPTLARPNTEQTMSGEFHAGRLAAQARPQFHALDPTLSPQLQAVARGLLPAVAWRNVRAAPSLRPRSGIQSSSLAARMLGALPARNAMPSSLAWPLSPAGADLRALVPGPIIAE